jgi:DNA polymerase III sliding clamp (beta) subunit (PCNA family)
MHKINKATDVHIHGAAGPVEIATAATIATMSDVPQVAPAHAAPESAVQPDFGTPILKIGSKVLEKAVAAVGFSAIDDYTEFLNNIAMFPREDGLYIGATDNHRMALVRVPPQVARCAQDNRRILVSCALLQGILKALNTNGRITLWADNDFLTVSYVNQWGTPTSVSISMPPANIRVKYPNLVAAAKHMEIGTRIEIVDRDELVVAIKTMLRASNFVRMKADTGQECFEIGSPEHPSVLVRCAPIQKGLSKRIALPTQFLLDSLTRISGEKVVLSFTPNEERAAIQSDNPDYLYLVQRLKNAPQ